MNDINEQSVIHLISQLSLSKPDILFDELDGTSKGEGSILLYLYHHDEAFAKDLAKDLKVSPARVAKILKKLEKKKMIIKIKSSTDKRKIAIKLREQGQKIVSASYKKTISKISSIVSKVGIKDIKEYIRISKKIKDSI